MTPEREAEIRALLPDQVEHHSACDSKKGKPCDCDCRHKPICLAVELRDALDAERARH